ncbi:beta-lactamase, putative [Verrucomicrobiia bacterium DG1235]|nr:beta-lactamase, putative [Verrucomicrobiae bacterium DG1235]
MTVVSLRILGLFVWAWVLAFAGGEELRELDDSLKRELQELMSDRFTGSNFRGASYSIAVPGYEVWTGTYGDLGRASSVEVTSGSVFGLASITKTYVAAIVLQLRDEGLLDLDDPIVEYIGAIENVPEMVTIRHLLSMTSGLANFSSHSAGPIRAAVANRGKVWEPEEVLSRYLSAPRFEAGARYMYSNTNYVLLGMLIERVTGEPFGDALRERLLEPLGLDETYLAGFDELPEELAWSDFTRDGRIDEVADAAQASVGSMFWTSGGMFATSEDLARWGVALYGGEVLSAASLAEMVNFGDDGFFDYGLGAMPESNLGYEFWGHGGLLSYVTSMIYSPDTGISIGFVASVDSMFSQITYWPHGDMLGRVRRRGIDQEIAFAPIRDQFTDTDKLELGVVVPKGIAAGQLVYKVVSGDASVDGQSVTLGSVGGSVSLRASYAEGGFYRGVSDVANFEVYSRFGDEDGDGLANALEGLLGSGVLDSNSRGVPWFGSVSGRFGMRFDRKRDDIPYCIEHSSNLLEWSEVELGIEEMLYPDGGARVFTPLDREETVLFFRIRAL